MAEGKFLEQVSIQQERKLLFPLYVPYFTYFYQGKSLPIRWAAASIDTLFKRRVTLKGVLRTQFGTEVDTRRYLHVNGDCNLWVILNGKDSHLESFWGMGEENRLQTLQQLNEIGFSLGTGATFSVSDLTHMNTPMPQSHNIAMLKRHHQIIHELQKTGFYSTPNLYWNDEDRNEIERWANWLIANPNIQSISRDFTSTKNLSTVLIKMNELIQLLKMVGRSFHVVIVGTGVTTAPKVIELLARNGHTGTIVTASPIFDGGKSAIKYEIEHGAIVRVKDSDTARSELILNNMKVFEQMLSATVMRANSNYKFLKNLY
ncbi:hypothetical protein DTQ70_01770 [Runella sp. SP2]|nr:hypothetical protein DTQ70_01770 [Runella sp. SP2]